MLRFVPARRAARCLYEALGVARNATSEEIKQAFRERAKETHPDMAEGTQAKHFQELVDAYRVLGDEKKRKEYDHEASSHPGGPGSGGEWPRGYGENMSEEFRA